MSLSPVSEAPIDQVFIHSCNHTARIDVVMAMDQMLQPVR